MTDVDRIKKLLKLTTSTYNGEALNAIRKANEEINRSGQTWDDVLEKGGSNYGDMIEIRRMKKSLSESFKERSMLEEDLRKSKSERDEYKRDYWTYKNKYDDIIRGRQTEQKEYTQRGEYVPKSKRGRR